MRKDAAAQEVFRLLGIRSERVVFAESCTAGLCAATLGAIPGVAKHLCGSAVVCMPKVKRQWVGVKKNTIKKHTTESQNVANEMALGVLSRTPCAEWAIAVVGNLTDAPAEKEGKIFVAIARRTRKNRLKIKDTMEYSCKDSNHGRHEESENSDQDMESPRRKQEEAVEVALTCLARHLSKQTDNDGKGSGRADGGITHPRKVKPGKTKGTDTKKKRA